MVCNLRWVLGILLLGLVAPACGVGFYSPDDDAADDDASGDDDGADDDGADDDGSDDDDDTTPSGNVTISAVSPSSGALVGGYEATIYGSNFTNGPDTDVFFGTSLAQMIGCSESDCAVIVPATAVEGAVQVSLENSNGVGVLTDGFTYTEDLSGSITYLVELRRIEYLDPSAFEPPPVSETFAIAYFFVPDEIDAYSDGAWGGLLPAMGSCVSYDATSNDWTTLTVNPYDAGSSISLNGPTSFTLPKTDFYYLADDQPLGSYQAGSYSLDIPGGTDIAAESLPAALTAPAPFGVTPPMNPSTMTPTQMSQGITVSIQGPNCPTAVLNADFFDATGTYWGSVLCHFASGQNMVMPGSYTSPYSTALGAAVQAECYSESNSTVASGASMAGIGRAMSIGIIWFQ